MIIEGVMWQDYRKRPLGLEEFSYWMNHPLPVGWSIISEPKVTGDAVERARVFAHLLKEGRVSINTTRMMEGMEPLRPCKLAKDLGVPAHAGCSDCHAAGTRCLYEPRCTVPPPGWECTRRASHDGPCAAVPAQPLYRVKWTDLLLFGAVYTIWRWLGRCE